MAKLFHNIYNKYISFFQKIIFFTLLSNIIYASNSCPEWYPLPYDDLVVVLPIYNTTIIKPDLDCDGIIDVMDADIDGDGVLNINDAFPRNANESIDTDNDGIGNNADKDDDNDGYSDTIEISVGTNPLDANDTPATQINLEDWVRTNPGAGGTINMIGATASGFIVTASDLSGVYINLDKNGIHWDALGELNGLKLTTHMSALGFHPTNGDTFYVGTGRGVYKTINKGQHFDFISSNIADNDANNTYVQSIVTAKQNANPNKTVMYVTYHKWDDNASSKIAKTTNEGLTWTDVSFPLNLRPSNLRIVKLIIHPQNADLIYAIAGKPRWGCSDAKAYRSENGGLNWMEIQHPYDVLDLDIDYSNENILYMSTFKVTSCENNATILFHDHPNGHPEAKLNGHAMNGHLYKSTNKGNSFGSPVLLNQTGIISVGTGHVNNANNVKLINILTLSSAYWMDENKTGTWESNNNGVTGSWTHIGTVSRWNNIGYGNNPYTAYASAFNGLNKTLTKDIFNSNRLFGAGGWTIGTFDGAKTFKSLSTKQVNVSKDTWKSTGLENINGFALDVNDNDENVIYMGGYDIGFWVSRDRGESWKWQYPFKNDLVTLNRYTWGASESEPDAWEPNTLRTIGGSNVMTLLSDPHHANVVWSSFAKAQAFDDAVIDDSDSSKNDRSGLFRSMDYGDTWTLSTLYKKDGTRLDTHKHTIIYGLSVDKNSQAGNRILYVTIDGDVAKSIDDGRTWHIIHEDGGLKFTAYSNNVLYAGGKSGLWRFKNNHWEHMGGALKTEMMGVGSPMIPDLTPQEHKTHYDLNWNEIIDMYAWNGVHDIQIDPINSNIVYVVVYGEGKGLYKSINGGNSWVRVNLGQFENKYLRYITINPKHPNNIFLTSSENINSGGAGGTSKGIIYSTNGGNSWKEANNAMAWKYGSKIEIDKHSERVWAWSPGTGIQYAEIK